MGLIPLSEALEFVRSRPRETTLVLTGRGAPPELLGLADIATEMRELKHHYRKGVGARKGVDY